MCFGCTANGRIVWSFIIAIFFIALTITVGVIWPIAANNYIDSELMLTEYSTSWQNWIKRPFPVLLAVYMYNWTNVENYKNWDTDKPNFVEMGPYVFMENVYREDVQYNKEETIVMFNQTKTWTFVPSMSNGSLSDVIFTSNPVTASLAHMVRKHPEDRVIFEIVEALLGQFATFYVGHTVQDWIFDGFEDQVLDWFKLIKEDPEGLPPGLEIEIPYEKFSWFYERNGSSIYDGRFEMFTGKDDMNKLGILKLWNNEELLPGLRGECAKVKGTTAEIWPTNYKRDVATFFVPDLCRTLDFKRAGSLEKHGLDGYKWIGDDSLFDNGEKYKENQCLCIEEENQCPAHKSGVFDASQCYYDGPVFFSYPHFYLADPFYTEAVRGMNPSQQLHESYIAVQPNTGVTLEVKVKFQLNILLAHDERLPYFQDFPDTYAPMFWFHQMADLPKPIADEIQKTFLLKQVGWWIVYTLIAIDFLAAICVGVVVWMKMKSAKEPGKYAFSN